MRIAPLLLSAGLLMLTATGAVCSDIEAELRFKAENTHDSDLRDWLVSEAHRRGIKTEDWGSLTLYSGGQPPKPKSKPSHADRAADWQVAPSLDLDAKA